jgi:glucans biosynthesis protein
LPIAFTKTMTGPGPDDTWQFVLDVAPLPAGVTPRLDVTSDGGELKNLVSVANPGDGGWRIRFDLDPGQASAVELRGRLLAGDKPLTETWLYRWSK